MKKVIEEAWRGFCFNETAAMCVKNPAIGIEYKVEEASSIYYIRKVTVVQL